MNGIHDVGGMDGFGPVVRDQDEHVFHEPWHGRMHAVAFAARVRGCFNLDEFRHAIERLHPVEYLTRSYYERWEPAVERLLIEKGYLTQEEVDARAAALAAGASPPRRDDPAITQQVIERLLFTPPTHRHESTTAPQFRPGDRVIVRTMHPKGHTRVPRYVRGKRGVIERYHGVHTFPDASAHGGGPAPQPLYAVRFDAREVWGPDYAGPDSISIDLWESYLEPARARRRTASA